MKRQFSAGGVVYKVADSGSVEWLITRSIPSKQFPKAVWRLPKGWLDDNNGGKHPGELGSGVKKATEEEIQSAALREVREEAGVEAKIIKKLKTERYFLTIDGERILKFATFYLMKFSKDLPEGFSKDETSEVAWLEFERARERLSYLREKKILDKAKETLESGMQNKLL